MTYRYRLIEHTADIGLAAYGKDLPEAFANAASGMFSIMTDLRKVRDVESRIVEVQGASLESLLFEWLNRLIYYFDVDKLLLKKFEIMKFGNNGLMAACHGERFDPDRHEIKIGVKSATYYLLQVDREHNRIRVIFDI